MEHATEMDVVGNYTTHSRDARALKSMSVVCRNARGVPVAGLCLNLDAGAGKDDRLEAIKTMYDDSFYGCAQARMTEREGNQ